MQHWMGMGYAGHGLMSPAESASSSTSPHPGQNLLRQEPEVGRSHQPYKSGVGDGGASRTPQGRLWSSGDIREAGKGKASVLQAGQQEQAPLGATSLLSASMQCVSPDLAPKFTYGCNATLRENVVRVRRVMLSLPIVLRSGSLLPKWLPPGFVGGCPGSRSVPGMSGDLAEELLHPHSMMVHA